jgi:putative ABC transport system ATP-binding protein
MQPIIKLKNITRNYGQGEIMVHALQDIDLALEPGSFVAVVGPSGSGKSTLLNIVGGLDSPTEGSIEIDGQNLTSLNRTARSRLRLRKIGFVFQAYNLLPVLTAYENAEYVLLLQGVPAKQRRERVMALLKRVGLQGLEKRFPRQLSGGQQQRVAVARAMAAEPALILADEPTANLDSKTAEALIDLMVELNLEKGVTFLFSTHDAHVMSHAKRLLQLTDGRITYDGDFEGLLRCESS